MITELLRTSNREAESDDRGVVYGSMDNDRDLPIDEELKSAVYDSVMVYAGIRFPIRQIFFEGQSEPTLIDGRGEIDIYCDPCDGSLNAKFRKNTIGLPTCCVLTFMPAQADLKISDALAAIVIDIRCNDLYLALREGNSIHSAVNGLESVVDHTAKEIDGRHIYYFEYYYPANREAVMSLLEGKKGWFRNPGSAAYEMVSVGAGTAAMFVCISQKQHELGAAYLFNKGAGAECINLKTGEDLGETAFRFNTQVPVGFFATKELKEEVLPRFVNFL